MSATRRRNPEDMFHLQYPAKRDFLSWVELGCLARALGFPTDIVRQHVNEEVVADEDGITIMQLNRMIELKLLNAALHRSFNMHTADWNLCVIRKAIKMLTLSVLSFEELSNIRVAYATYEASDMKGLALDQRILLRTLKMCHRVISPKKLMHRVKHMRSKLEEANRIQLYEFYDLVLWCDYMESRDDVDLLGEAEGKEKDLYNLVDFEDLLSHQDQRRSRVLDERYLAEEWDFGRERLGSKHMFKGEVVYTDQRIKQTRNQMKNYRGLKKAVNQSQRRVYRAHAGSIRQRPISAPDLSMYGTPRGTPRSRTASAAAMYHDVQRRLHSAPSRASKVDVSDRPAIPEYVRAHTPSVVTTDDLDDVKLKMERLQFDIITLETRCEVKKKDEMNFYIPDYKPSTSGVTIEVVEQKEEKPQQHWTPDIIDKLVNPHHHLPPHHAHTCDARFRGWKPAEQRGRHKILTVPTFDSSPHGMLLAKQRAVMLAPVANMHKDYVVRYTSKKQATEQQKTKRPCTAPAASPRMKPVKRIGCRSAGNQRLSESHGTEYTTEDMRTSESEGTRVEHSFPDPNGKYSKETVKTLTSKVNDPDLEEGQGEKNNRSTTFSSTLSQSPVHKGHPEAPSRSEESSPKMASEHSEDGNGQNSMPISSSSPPSIRHNRAKMVDMGLMGTITLLESIQEHDVEDRLSDSFSSSSPSWVSHDQLPKNAYSTGQGGQHDSPDLLRAPRGIPSSCHDSRSFKDSGVVVMDESYIGSGNQSQGADIKSIPSGKGGRVDQDVKNIVPTHSSDKPSVKADLVQRNQRQPLPVYATTNAQQNALSNKVKVELLPKARPQESSDVPKQRVGSATSSIVSDESDPREPHTPLTSVTVTIKNKDQNVRKSTRVNNDIEDQFNIMDDYSQSPVGFKQTPPCITSTPRRKRISPSAKTLGSSGNSAKTNSSSSNRPGSARKDKNNFFSPPNSRLSTERQLSWVQDQILAMNSACDQKAEEEEEQAQDTLSESKELRGYSANRDTSSADEERRWNIKFSPDSQDPREIAYQNMMRSRKNSERLLKLKDFNLDAETATRFTFNNATTRRLIQRVQDIISPELKTRIRTGDTGLKVA